MTVYGSQMDRPTSRDLSINEVFSALRKLKGINTMPEI